MDQYNTNAIIIIHIIISYYFCSSQMDYNHHVSSLQVGLGPVLSLVSLSSQQSVVSGVYQQGGDMLLDTRQLNSSGFAGPLYWRLPPQTEGNQVQ